MEQKTANNRAHSTQTEANVGVAGAHQKYTVVGARAPVRFSMEKKNKTKSIIVLGGLAHLACDMLPYRYR